MLASNVKTDDLFYFLYQCLFEFGKLDEKQHSNGTVFLKRGNWAYFQQKRINLQQAIYSFDGISIKRNFVEKQGSEINMPLIYRTCLCK